LLSLFDISIFQQSGSFGKISELSDSVDVSARDGFLQD
jgi:hypothetical protein